MDTRTLAQAYAQAVRRNFRELLRTRRPWARPCQAQRAMAFKRCWEDASHDARIELGLSELEVNDVASTAPDYPDLAEHVSQPAPRL